MTNRWPLDADSMEPVMKRMQSIAEDHSSTKREKANANKALRESIVNCVLIAAPSTKNETIEAAILLAEKIRGRSATEDELADLERSLASKFG